MVSQKTWVYYGHHFRVECVSLGKEIYDCRVFVEFDQTSHKNSIYTNTMEIQHEYVSTRLDQFVFRPI